MTATSCPPLPAPPESECRSPAPLRRGWRPRRVWPLVWLLCALLATAIFVQWPQLDLWVSAAVHHPQSGFVWRDSPWVTALHVAIPWVGRIALLLCLAAALWPRQRLRPGLPSRWHRRSLTLLAVLLVGLWGAVNAGLKEWVGRPRPVAVQAFGGPHPFHTLGQSSPACQRNCSFVSGHAATGFVVMALGMAGTPRVRRRWALAGLGAGAVAGLGRILQGGHFFSDIVFAGLVIAAVCLLLRRLWVMWRWLRRRHARRARLQVAPQAGQPVQPQPG